VTVHDLAMSTMLQVALSGRAAVWVRVEQSQGSAPREAGASMLVGEGFVEGTIGGGHLEYQAIDVARAVLRDPVGGVAPPSPRAFLRRLALGPSLGQCCGGAVELSFRLVDLAEIGWVQALADAEQEAMRAGSSERVLLTRAGETPHSRVIEANDTTDGTGPTELPELPDPTDQPDTTDPDRVAWRSTLHFAPWHVWVFGAGHVGQALVRILSTLPACVTWVDSRDDVFPQALPGHVVALSSDGPAHEVAAIPAGADVVVMTHSHALDFDICAALLARDDLGWCGVIGSRTKASTFRRRLAQRGIDAARIGRLACPIGRSAQAGPDPASRSPRSPQDKHPGAIALDIALQLWERRRATRTAAQVPA
jgi:xanthine dehydrogenase accessory factor